MYLEVRRANAKRDTREKRLHDKLELRLLNHLQDLLNLVEEEDLLRRECARPALEYVQQDRFGKLRVFLDELCDAVGELLVVHRDVVDFMQR